MNIIYDQFLLSLGEGPTDNPIIIKGYYNIGRNSDTKVALIETNEWRILSLIWDEKRDLPGTYVCITKNNDPINFALCKMCFATLETK